MLTLDSERMLLYRDVQKKLHSCLVFDLNEAVFWDRFSIPHPNSYSPLFHRVLVL